MREPQEHPKLKTPLIISAAVHIAAVIFVAVSPQLNLPFRDKPISINMMWVELPRGTSEDIGLGVKQSEGLPKSTIEEQKKLFDPEKPEQEAMAPKPKEPLKRSSEPEKPQVKRPSMTLPPDMKVKRQEPSRLPKGSTDRKIQSALAKIGKELKQRSVVPESAQLNSSSEGYKYGTGTKPLRVLPSDPEYLKYQALVRGKIIREWIVPARYSEEGGTQRNASLEVLINIDGEVVSVRWMAQSGDSSFDQSAIRAVKKSSPFPKPPDRLAWEAYNEGFLVEFDTRLKGAY